MTALVKDRLRATREGKLPVENLSPPPSRAGMDDSGRKKSTAVDAALFSLTDRT